METEQLSGISALHQEKKPFAIGRLVKKNWKKLQFSGILQVSSVLKTKIFFFFSLALQSYNKNVKNVIFLKNSLKIKVHLIVCKIWYNTLFQE